MDKKPATDPKVDWGFYAMTPRIVRTKYKDLSHTEKWLYTCLRDLCGKKGTCFRTLRSLKEETDISIASLSAMIPRLHAAGLIHAEKKRRSTTGKEIWHISIVDIWQMNKDYCSENEQNSGEDVQNLNNDPEIVQSVNNDVQNLNKTPGDCSENERDCSNFRNRRRYSKNKDTEIYNEEEGTYSGEQQPAASGANAPTPAPVSSQDDLLNQIRSRIPEGDAVLLERLSNGNHRIYRKSGRSIGELIPVGVDVSDGLLELITVDADVPYQPDFDAHKTDSYSQPTEDHDNECMGRSSVSGDDVRHLHGAQGDSPHTQRDTRQVASASDTGTNRLSESADGHAHQLAGRDQQTRTTTGQPATVVPANGDGYQKPQQQTLTGVSQQESARVEPKAEQDVLIERPAVPEMPLQSARWCAETLVQIVEAKNQKYYRKTTREKQIKAAQRILREDPELTRERFVLAYDERNDDWWSDHKGLLHVNHMAEKDRVHEMLERIDLRATRRGSKPSSQPQQSNGKGHTLAVNDPDYNIDDDFYNNAAAWAAFDVPKGGTVHV